MHLQTDRRAQWAVFHLDGRYGSLEFRELREVEGILLHLAVETEPACLLIDLQDTEYFGSAFIGILLECYRKVKHRRAQFALCNVCPELRKELVTMRLDSVIPIYESREAALQALGGPEMVTVQSARPSKPGGS